MTSKIDQNLADKGVGIDKKMGRERSWDDLTEIEREQIWDHLRQAPSDGPVRKNRQTKAS